MFRVTLRAARINGGYSIKEVAAKVGKNPDTISRYEHDSSSIPLDLLVSLLDLYVFPTDNIFFGKESDFIELIQRKAKTKAERWEQPTA